MKRWIFTSSLLVALTCAGRAGAQSLVQTDWTGGPGLASTTDLATEDGFDNATGHALHATVPGAVRVVQFLYSQADGVYEVMPVRVDQDPEDYYDYQGFGGTVTYPEPRCLEGHFWLYRELGTGALSWMFHVNVNGLPTDPCLGEIDATYDITPGGVATLVFTDETDESWLTGFDHEWQAEWSDGHIISFDEPVFNVAGTIDRVLGVDYHAMFLDDAGAVAELDMSDLPEWWEIDADVNGRLESPVFDTGAARDWAEITADVTATPGAAIELWVRAGTDVASTQAAAWAGPFSSGDDISGPLVSDMRHIQYAIVVALADPALTPGSVEQVVEVREVEILFDTDGDDISDGGEVIEGTLPGDDDTDDDGITDGAEVALGTDPTDADTDGDGILDGTEIGLTDPQGDDTDTGVFVADQDPTTTTDPTDPDTDGGGAADGSEDANHDGEVDTGECDPLDDSDDGGCMAVDTDGDGLSDDLEGLIGTDPLDADSDDDGVTDGGEPDYAEDTDGDGLINAMDPDSDDDGLMDGTEMGVTEPDADTDVGSGNFVADQDPTTTTDPLDPDTDDGGVDDGDEDTNLDGAVDTGEIDPLDPSDDIPMTDTDGDGLTDDQEIELGTDPLDADSDDDGVLDGDEPNYSSDTDGDGLINALDPDSDGDGIFDGTELGVTEPDEDTDVSEGHFVPDADPSTTTSAVDPDTDGGGVSDGDEDGNHDGAMDEDECDPNDPSDDGLCAPEEDLLASCGSGCACQVADGAGRAWPAALLALLALLVLALVRRRAPSRPA